jgi:hypothetical protein
MPTKTISQLPVLTQLNANTSNTLFVVVDIPSGVDGTKSLTANVLARWLYAYETLNVGGNVLVTGNTGLGTATPTHKLHVIGTTSSDSFISTVGDGTAPLVVYSTTPVANLTANTVVNANLSGEVTTVGTVATLNNASVISQNLTGFVSSNGVISSSDSIISSIQKLDGNDVLNLNTAMTFANTMNVWLQANDAVTLNTAMNYTNDANTFLQANDFITLNTAINYTNAANVFLQANDFITLNTAINYTNAANTFLQANDFITLNTAINYTNAANVFLQANDAVTLNTAINYTNAANVFLQANDTITLNSARSYTDNANTYLIGLINYQTTNRFYVDPSRTDTYTATGSLNKPFKTVGAALTYIHDGIDNSSITNPQVNPIYISLKNSTTENITLTRGKIFLVGESSVLYNPITINGTITVNGANTSTNAIDVNYFVLSGLSVIGGDNNACIQTSGSNAQSLLLKDIKISASGSTGVGIYANNTGVRSSDGKLSFIRGSDIIVSHTGTGDVYCFNINKGTAEFTNVETINATQVGAAQTGAKLSFIGSQLQANGATCVESYGTGELNILNSSITNTRIAADTYGIWLHDSGSLAIVDQCRFDIRDTVNSGSRAVKGVSGSIIVYSNLSFAANSTYGSTNNLLDTAVSYYLLTNSFTRV